MSDLVHQMKDCKGQAVTTKCGLEGKRDKLRTTAWHSDITCGDCNPNVRSADEHSSAGVLGSDAGL